jgi:hypothetical protein
MENWIQMIEFTTIFVFSILQSIFGIGILFFGTPTLILMGFTFVETLSVLLPASIAVSLFQVAKGGLPERRLIGTYAGWCLAPLAITLIASLLFGWDVELELFVAVALSVYVAIRLSRRMESVLRSSVRRLPKVWLPVIGVVHCILLSLFRSHPAADTDRPQVPGDACGATRIRRPSGRRVHRHGPAGVRRDIYAGLRQGFDHHDRLLRGAYFSQAVWGV